MAIVASDSFGRTLADSWGSADVGGAWALRQGAATDIDVDGSVGIMDMHASGTRSVTLPVSVADIDITAKATWDVPAANLVPFQIMARWASTTVFYYAQLGLSSATTLRISISVFNGTATTLAGPFTVTSAYVPGSWWWLRFQIQGTALKAKGWADGSAEPGAWQLEISDGTLAPAGAIGLRYSGSAVQTFASVDDFVAVDFAAAAAGEGGRGRTGYGT